jgi:hypothetical protein
LTHFCCGPAADARVFDDTFDSTESGIRSPHPPDSRPDGSAAEEHHHLDLLWTAGAVRSQHDRFRNSVELGELVRKSDAENKALFINLGYLTTVEGEHQNKYELLRSSGFFEDLGILPGFEPTMHSRHVFRYIPGSAAKFDFEKVSRDRGRPGTGYSY